MDPRVELDEFVAYIRSEYPSAPIKTIKKTWIKLKRFFDGEHKAQYIVIEALADVEKMVDTFLAAANVEEEEEHKETPADSSNHVQSSASRNTRSTRIRSTRKCSDTSGSSNLKPESLAAMRTSVLFQPVSPSRISRYGGNHWGILNDIFNVPEATKYQPGEICYEASARRKNDQWTSPLVKQQCGRKADGIFKSATKATDVRHRLAIYGMRISAGTIAFYSLQHRHGRFFQLTCEGSAAFPTVWQTDGANTSEILTVITLLLAFQQQIKAMARMVSDLTSAKFKLHKATSGKADDKWPRTLTTPGRSPRISPTTLPTLPLSVAIPAPASTL
ncbi:hypothetical protein EDD21DRAFT_415077 [Dissophora ornata]|nr:hypothetical protein EDD21DRAFT_415077 [Dissophora ornata]